MIKEQFYTINIYDKKEGEVIEKKHTFDLQQAQKMEKRIGFW